MAFCPNCGAQVAGAFCPNCGTNVAAAAAGATGPTGAAAAAGVSYAAPPQALQAGGISANAASCLCYVPFLVGLVCSIIFLVAAPHNKNKFVRFNAFQSLFLHAAIFVISIVLNICLFIFGLMTHGLGFLFGALFPILWICVLVLFVVMMVKASQGVKVKLPIIGDLADKQA